jgi:hypothetical protein
MIIDTPSGKRGNLPPRARTLSPISSNMNKAANPPTHKTNGTIRSVPSDPPYLETPRGDEESRRPLSKSEQMPHSTTKHSTANHSQPPLTRNNAIARSISTEFGATRFPAPSSLAVPAPTEDPQWSSAVGRANLGKSGRVIERLMGENDMLKREVNIERLKAAESKEAVKMAEGRMEALQTEFETKAHDAAVAKSLLKRRERQLMDLKGTIEMERDRADKAVESERVWREAMEKLEVDARRKVEEAQLFASLMEGRNKTLTGHWKEQQVLIDQKVGKMKIEIGGIVEERRKDDERMNMLQNLCEQQAEELAKLRTEKEGIGEAFEKYKRTQDEGLSGTKNKLVEQEKENERVLKESLRVLGELKWALNVKTNVPGAH